MPAEVTQAVETEVPAANNPQRQPVRRPSLFRRIFRIPEAVAEVEDPEMTEYSADAWLATRSPVESEPENEEEMFAKSTVKLEAILSAVNITRSPIRIEELDEEPSKWAITFFSDGIVPYQVEVWSGNQLRASSDKDAALAVEEKLVFGLDDTVNMEQGFKLMLVARTKQTISPIISQGRMMAGVQVTHLSILPLKDSKTFEVKVEKQKILISNFEVDLFEIYGQPHNIPAQKSDQPINPNRSQTSFFSNTNTDLPGFNRECVICLSQRRDTLFLPCRHMCLCLPCAESLCQHSDKCPICRQEFRSMLSINDV